MIGLPFALANRIEDQGVDIMRIYEVADDGLVTTRESGPWPGYVATHC
jgi:hypothetical protein